MARIAGVDLPRDKRVEIALTYIFGIGKPTSQKILSQTGVNPDTRVKNLAEEEINKLRDVIEKNLKVEGDLRREIALNIKRLIEIGSYRGLRHRRGMPVRGQRTKTNADRKGPRTVGVRRKIYKEVMQWRVADRSKKRERKNMKMGLRIGSTLITPSLPSLILRQSLWASAGE